MRMRMRVVKKRIKRNSGQGRPREEPSHRRRICTTTMRNEKGFRWRLRECDVCHVILLLLPLEAIVVGILFLFAPRESRSEKKLELGHGHGYVPLSASSKDPNALYLVGFYAAGASGPRHERKQGGI